MVINTKEAKAKLANLREHMSERSDHEVAFSAMVGARLPEEAEPSAVAMAAAFVLYDVGAGKAPASQLTGLPAVVLSLIDDAFDEVIRMAFPAEFASEVVSFRVKTRESV